MDKRTYDTPNIVGGNTTIAYAIIGAMCFIGIGLMFWCGKVLE